MLSLVGSPVKGDGTQIQSFFRTHLLFAVIRNAGVKENCGAFNEINRTGQDFF